MPEIKPSQVIVSTSIFKAEHDRLPRGMGRWAFYIGGKTVFFPVDDRAVMYSEAKEMAQLYAGAHGIQRIDVAP